MATVLDDAFPVAVRRLARKWYPRVHRLTGDATRGDEEAVHDMRTGLRRLRTLFGLLPEDHHARQLRKRGRPIAEALGKVRDLDVLVAGLATDSESGKLPDGPAVEAWRTSLREEHDKARGELRNELHSGRFGAWTQDLADWAAGDAKGPPVANALPCILLDLIERAEAKSPPVDDKALHKLRIAIKRIRYFLEFFDDVLPEPKAAIIRCTAAQDALGEYHDVLGRVGRLTKERKVDLSKRLDAKPLTAYRKKLESDANRAAAVDEASRALSESRLLLAKLVEKRVPV